jgi:crossover junction endodeoxyribonuclease RuvC
MMRTIGIDPGTAIMGWGIIEQHGSTVTLVACGALTTPAGMPQAERLLILYRALLALAHAGLSVYEYKPIVIKQTVAGYGGADKKQMQEMVRLTLRMPQIIKPDDAADAVAVAICHAYTMPMTQRIRNAGSV